jgi:hypothetical protein
VLERVRLPLLRRNAWVAHHRTRARRLIYAAAIAKSPVYRRLDRLRRSAGRDRHARGRLRQFQTHQLGRC